MGLFKKLAEKTAAGLPDHQREIAKLLSPGESVVGWGPICTGTGESVAASAASVPPQAAATRTKALAPRNANARGE